MASEVGICSNALRKLGDDPITSLEDNSDRARLCNNLYAPARDELLQMRNWNFAIERVQLAALSDAPAFTWSYQYQLPGACIRPIRLQYIDEDYIIEGRKILTNATTVNLIYLKQVTDPNLFTPLFIQALEAKLASELAYPITGDLNVQTIWSQISDRKLSDAGYMDAMEQGTPAQVWSEDFINSRYANNGYTVDRRDL